MWKSVLYFLGIVILGGVAGLIYSEIPGIAGYVLAGIAGSAWSSAATCVIIKE